MIMFWILLGALMASVLWFMYVKVHAVRRMSAAAWLLTIIADIWAGFTLAWMASSIMEGEIRAAGMGLLVFGILLIVLVVGIRVMITGKNPASMP